VFDWDAFLITKKPHNRFSYGQRKLCKNCEKPIVDTNKSGLCTHCCQAVYCVHSTEEGSKHLTKQGYVMIRVNGQFISEHRYVWEQAHTHMLTSAWVVHHLNGIRDDNRPENLIALRKKDHSPWLQLQACQARIRELEKPTA